MSYQSAADALSQLKRVLRGVEDAETILRDLSSVENHKAELERAVQLGLTEVEALKKEASEIKAKLDAAKEEAAKIDAVARANAIKAAEAAEASAASIVAFAEAVAADRKSDAEAYAAKVKEAADEHARQAHQSVAKARAALEDVKHESIAAKAELDDIEGRIAKAREAAKKLLGN